ncbi:MAG: hypothetical protein KC733_03320 [Candidatus Omnitrophica bacterium]|nr:hypothetical protein [Candidatus Omnitrophota bacterium]
MKNKLVVSMVLFFLIVISISLLNGKLEKEVQGVSQYKQPQLNGNLLKTQKIIPVSKKEVNLSESSSNQASSSNTIQNPPSEENSTKSSEQPKIIYEIPLDDVILDL